MLRLLSLHLALVLLFFPRSFLYTVHSIVKHVEKKEEEKKKEKSSQGVCLTAIPQTSAMPSANLKRQATAVLKFMWFVCMEKQHGWKDTPLGVPRILDIYPVTQTPCGRSRRKSLIHNTRFELTCKSISLFSGAYGSTVLLTCWTPSSVSCRGSVCSVSDHRSKCRPFIFRILSNFNTPKTLTL